MNLTMVGMTPRGKFNIITDTNKYRFRSEEVLLVQKSIEVEYPYRL